MYTDIKTILKNAAENNYAVLATSPINLESARGMVRAAEEKKAPIIFLLGQNMMRQHAKAELIIPMIKTLAEYSTVPIATCLDHGNDPERLMYAFRNGFSSIMFDGSLLSFEENIKETKRIASICISLAWESKENWDTWDWLPMEMRRMSLFIQIQWMQSALQKRLVLIVLPLL